MLKHQLIEECRANNRKAQLKLYNSYCDGMFIVASRFLKNSAEAEDAMQEAFVKAFAKLHQYSGEVTFGAWLKRIVINKCLDCLKAKKLEYVALNEQLVEKVEDEDAQDWQIDDGIGIGEVKAEIQELPEKYKYPLMLYLIEGYDHEEISEILKISQVASRTLVHRGKKKLQEKLKVLRDGTRY
ncbi:MAG TPA: sigma-70 family RNA polymerase sigma factor [Gillisia sp.]|nr:sigma-70 family RNA polymerase sigma factor [Gillisia sp.]